MVKAPLNEARKKRSLSEGDDSKFIVRRIRAASRNEVLTIRASSGLPGSRSSQVDVTIVIPAVAGTTDPSTSPGKGKFDLSNI